MNQVVRNKTFETNSSTSHNMVIIPDEYYEDWNNNKLWYMRYTWGDENKKLLEENNGSRLFTEEFLKSHGVFTDEPDIDNYESEDEYEAVASAIQMRKAKISDTADKIIDENIEAFTELAK